MPTKLPAARRRNDQIWLFAVWIALLASIPLANAADDPADSYIRMVDSGDVAAEQPKLDDVPLLISQLSAPKAQMRANAEWMLAQPSVIGRAAAAEPLLLENLNFPDNDVQAGAANVLGKLKSAAAVSALQRVLFARNANGKREYRQWTVRLLAARALGEIGPAGNSPIPELREMMNNDYYIDKAFAVEALAYMGDRSSIPLIMALLTSPPSDWTPTPSSLNPNAHPWRGKEADVKTSAVDALTRLHATQAIPLFIENLRLSKSYEEGHLRVHLAHALGRLHAESAIPVLKQALKDGFNACSPPLNFGDCYAVRAAAQKALREIGTPVALNSLKPWWLAW